MQSSTSCAVGKIIASYGPSLPNLLNQYSPKIYSYCWPEVILLEVGREKFNILCLVRWKILIISLVMVGTIIIT